MKRYFDLNLKTDNNYCDDIDNSYMVEIPDDGKPYGIAENAVAEISQTAEYKNRILTIEKENREKALQLEIESIDIKRIRAIAEPELKDESTTWLEYYTNQIQELRTEIKNLS